MHGHKSHGTGFTGACCVLNLILRLPIHVQSSGGETDERCAPARRAMMLCAATSVRFFVGACVHVCAMSRRRSSRVLRGHDFRMQG